MIKKIGLLIRNHKILTFIFFALLLGGGYYVYQKISKKEEGVRYVTQTAEKGTLVVTVGGTGQIFTSQQINLFPKVAGEVDRIKVESGKSVSAGDLLLTLDDKDAQNAVRDALLDLESAQLDFNELQSSPDPNLPDATTQAQNAAYNTIADAFVDLATMITTLNDILYNSSYLEEDTMGTYDATSQEYKETAQTKYVMALDAYNQNLKEYKVITRESSAESIINVLNLTENTSKLAGEAVKNTDILLEHIDDQIDAEDRPASLTRDQNSLDIYTGQVNTHLESIISDRDAILVLSFDLESQSITLQQKQNDLSDAQVDLKDYQILASVDGIIAAINVEENDQVTTSTAVVTLVSHEMISEISLNEVDVPKVKIGQKATLTFDAFDEYKITGKVFEIDLLGTVEQGVVTYNVKVSFDAINENLKPGMSVSANITTEVKEDVILVPNSALEQKGDSYFVKTMVDGKPRLLEVQIGLANEMQTEILSGIAEGDEIITQSLGAEKMPADERNRGFFPGQSRVRMR